MESVLVSLIVSFVFLVVAGIIGHRLGKRPRPYGFVTPVIHIVLFVFVFSGVLASIYKLQAIPGGREYVHLFLYVTMLALLINLVVGIWMLLIKGKNRNLRAVHKMSTYVMAGSIIAGIGFIAAAI